jgi:glutathione S-transferase
MIKLYQFNPMWNLPNLSPYCLKLETYLRMAKVPFEIVPNADIRKAPKGKMPFIEHEGKQMGDSNLIIEYLKEKFGDPLDQHLSPAEKGVALAFARLMEENFYWVALYARWGIEGNFKKVSQAFFSFLPFPLRWIVPKVVRKNMLKQLYGHGMGRHSSTEIFEIGKKDLSAVSDFLGNKPFFLGNQPTTVDATLYGFLANILWVPIESVLKEHAKRLKNLEAYCQRMKEKFYS